MAERPVCIRKAQGSIPCWSNIIFVILLIFFLEFLRFLRFFGVFSNKIKHFIVSVLSWCKYSIPAQTKQVHLLKMTNVKLNLVHLHKYRSHSYYYAATEKAPRTCDSFAFSDITLEPMCRNGKAWLITDMLLDFIQYNVTFAKHPFGATDAKGQWWPRSRGRSSGTYLNNPTLEACISDQLSRLIDQYPKSAIDALVTSMTRYVNPVNDPLRSVFIQTPKQKMDLPAWSDVCVTLYRSVQPYAELTLFKPLATDALTKLSPSNPAWNQNELPIMIDYTPAHIIGTDGYLYTFRCITGLHAPYQSLWESRLMLPTSFQFAHVRTHVTRGLSSFNDLDLVCLTALSGSTRCQ